MHLSVHITFQINQTSYLFLQQTNPVLANNFDQFDLCYPKPTIFLSVFE